MKPELKRCPFCGSCNVELMFLDYSEMYAILCGGCGASSGRHPSDKKLVVEGWNKRVLEDEAIADAEYNTRYRE